VEENKNGKMLIKKLPHKAQATLEFIFAFIVLLLIFYGAVRAMQWAGVVFGSSSNQHYALLHNGCTNTGALQNKNNWEMAGFNTLQQLGDGSSTPLPKLKMTYDGNIINP